MEVRSLLICLMLLFSVRIFRLVATSPKIGNEATQTQKWPNFFNPKQSILRDTNDKDDEKIKRKNAKVSHSAKEESEVEENVEDLIDYTLKGGLRGMYVLLNGTTSNIEEHLSNEAQTSIRNILEGEVWEGVSKMEYLGEKTEEGLRLRTPLVTKHRTKSMGKYGAQISYFATDTPQHFIYFGNWCGKGGRSGPVDNIDACCLEHEKCYGRQIRQCPDVWQKPYSNMYGWALLEEKHPICVRSESLCVNHVCNCDLEAALCFDHYLHHPTEIPLHMVDRASPEKLTLEADYTDGQDSMKQSEENEEEKKK